MAESPFRQAREEIESRTEIPDFDLIAARGHRLRRRRRAAGAAASMLAVAAVLGIGVALQPSDRDRGADPVEDPTPFVEQDAAAIIAHPDAVLDVDNLAVGPTGDFVVVVTAPGAPARPSCPGPAAGAFVWIGADGGFRAWSDYATGRGVEAVPGGFVVAAAPEGCRSETRPEDALPYFIDAEGNRRDISWETGPGGESMVDRCKEAPHDDRCRFSVTEGRAWVAFADEVAYPPRAVPIDVPSGSERYWARSIRSDRVYWSDDFGQSWTEHGTTLPRDENVSVVLAGDRVAFVTDTEVEYSTDAGWTWAVRDLSQALSSITIGDVRWHLTESGNLLGVTALVGKGEQLFRSTDPSWTRFESTEVRTGLGLIYPFLAGRHVYVPDNQEWRVSADDGRTWRTVDPFALAATAE